MLPAMYLGMIGTTHPNRGEIMTSENRHYLEVNMMFVLFTLLVAATCYVFA